MIDGHAEEHARESTGPFYLNEYLTNRAYGGDEEGGWWYDTGEFVTCHGTFETRDAALGARDANAEWLGAKREGLAKPSSTQCSGWPELIVEAREGADFPKEIPRYE